MAAVGAGSLPGISPAAAPGQLCLQTPVPHRDSGIWPCSQPRNVGSAWASHLEQSSMATSSVVTSVTTLAQGLGSARERQSQPEPGPASSFQESCECHVCHLQLLVVTLAHARPWPQCDQRWSQLQPSLAAAQPCVHAKGSRQSPEHPAATDALSS